MTSQSDRTRLIAAATRRGRGRRPVNPPIERGSTLLNDSAALMRNSNTVAGSYWFTRTNLHQLIRMAESGVLDFGAFRETSFRIDDIHTAIRYATSQAGGLEHTALVP